MSEPGNSTPPDDIDGKFDDTEITGEFKPIDADDHPLRIHGVPADAWATGIEQKLDFVFRAQYDGLQSLLENLRAVKDEMRDGFKQVIEGLKAIERHEVQLQNHQEQLNEHRQEHQRLADKVTTLEGQVTTLADKVTRLEARRRSKLP